jgi:hypothetical protein
MSNFQFPYQMFSHKGENISFSYFCTEEEWDALLSILKNTSLKIDREKAIFWRGDIVNDWNINPALEKYSFQEIQDIMEKRGSSLTWEHDHDDTGRKAEQYEEVEGSYLDKAGNWALAVRRHCFIETQSGDRFEMPAREDFGQYGYLLFDKEGNCRFYTYK